eukprot:SAG11_NODE_1212_length_5506_cov_3.818384_6_plen_34_part_00
MPHCPEMLHGPMEFLDASMRVYITEESNTYRIV